MIHMAGGGDSVRPPHVTEDESTRALCEIDETERDGNNEPVMIAMNVESAFRSSFTITIGRRCLSRRRVCHVCGLIVVDYFDDVGEGNFDDVAVGALHFNARFGERLSHLHAADNAAHACAVGGDDLYIIFGVKRLQCGESFGDFHLFDVLSVIRCKFAGSEALSSVVTFIASQKFVGALSLY